MSKRASNKDAVRPSFSLRDRIALRPREAADVLGLSVRGLRQILPRLPHFRVGTAVLVPVDMLREWVREQARIEEARVRDVVEDMNECLGIEK